MSDEQLREIARKHGVLEYPCVTNTIAALREAYEAGAGQYRQERMASRTELGCAGHLIVANRCRWKRHTQVGNYRISSIGDYYPDGKTRDTIGAGDETFFETMVFETNADMVEDAEGCGCRTVKSWSEIDGERYATAGEAQAGHERYVAKYAAIDAERGKDAAES